MDKFLRKVRKNLDEEKASMKRSRESSSTTTGTDDRRDKEPPAKKKRISRYRQEWTDEFPFMKKSRLGDTHVFCEYCRCDIGVSCAGKDSLLNHISTKKHKEGAKAWACATADHNNIQTFFSASSDLSVIRAETLFTNFLMESNIPMAASDKFNKLVKTMFPDSEIAKKYSCGRTKSTAISQSLGMDSMKSLAQHMRHNSYSISTDGSNKGDKQLYPIVVRIFDEVTGQIETRLLSIAELESASSARNISNLVLSELKRFSIPFSNCISFSADNCNVIMGRHGGVATLLREDNSNLIVVGCPCHHINNCAKKAAKVLPSKVEDALVDIYYFFKHSEKRQIEFKECQVLCNKEVKKILQYCPTRWLSLSPCLKRLVELWQPLYFYISKLNAKEKESRKKKTETKQISSTADNIIPGWFKTNDNTECETESSSSSRLDRIYNFLSSRCNLIYCAFLLRIIPDFENSNALLQSKEPMILKTRMILLQLYNNLLTRLVKPTIITQCTDILDVDYKNESNHLLDSQFDLGSLANGLMEKLKSKAKASIYAKCKCFLVSALNYMQTKFPLRNDVLVAAAGLVIENRAQWQVSDLNFFIRKFNVSPDYADLIMDEFRLFRTFVFPPHIVTAKRVDQQLFEIQKLRNPVDNKPMFYNLCFLLLKVLCIPHSNADPERIFSVVRKNYTENRASMSIKMLESLLVNKLNCSDFCPSDETLRRCKRATRESLAATTSQ